MGYTPHEIQQELDAQNAYVRQIAKAIAAKAEEAKKNGELKEGEFLEELKKKEEVEKSGKREVVDGEGKEG